MARLSPLRTTVTAAATLACTLLTALASCSDDGAGVRDEGSTSGSGSGSRSGLSEDDLGERSSDRQIQAAADEYRQYVTGQAAALRTDAKRFTDAVRAGDVAGARRLYAPSRVRWERIEPIAALIGDIDADVDGRVDDFAGVADPAFTGWHRLEHLLFVTGSTEGAVPFADKLDADLATLDSELGKLEINALFAVRGAAELIDEVFQGKITGEEDRYSGTDLWDLAANVEGARAVFDAFTEPLRARDAALHQRLAGGFDAVTTSLSAYQLPDGGYKPYRELTAADKARMQAQLSALAEDLVTVPAVLELG